MSPPKNRANFYKSGMAAFINKAYDTAIDFFSKELDQQPDAYRVWVSRGASYLKAGHVDLAMSDLSKAVELKPSYARAFHVRALAFDLQGDTDAALDDLDEAIAIDPEYGAAYHSRAAILSKTGQEDRAVADMQMVTHLTELKLSQFAEENNILRSRHFTLEAEGIVSELDR